MAPSGGNRSTDRDVPVGERLRMQVEHELDTRSTRLAVWLLRRTKGRISHLWHRRMLALTTRGRRTGLPRTVPVQFFPDGDSLVVAAANSGLPRPPAWYLNVTAEPRATVEVEGRTFDVLAQELSADEAVGFWPRVLEAAPDYARYPRRAGRRLPLLRLTPVEARSSPDRSSTPDATLGRPLAVAERGSAPVIARPVSSLEAARILGALRVAAGTAFALAPARAGRLLVGEDAATPGARLFIAAFGARDALLGLGVLRALARRESPRTWIAACAAADGLDALTCLALRRDLGANVAARSFLASATPAVPETWIALRLDAREVTDDSDG